VTDQNFEKKTRSIRDRFVTLKQEHPERFERRLEMSWSNWGFGLEPLEMSCDRLERAGLSSIELHGNHYGPDLGYRIEPTMTILRNHGLSVSGVCGMFSADNDLSSPQGIHRQAAVDYIRREVEFTVAVGGTYLLVVPSAVGRTTPYDDAEIDRSSQTLRDIANIFVSSGIRAAIEPIRSAETSLVHTVDDAIAYIERVDHPGVQHINGDVFHMQAEEPHIGEAILHAGERLINLHMADSNRLGLGEGSMDLDVQIMALYLIGFNRAGHFVTPEPLGPGGSPYPAMHRHPDPDVLERLVLGSVRYFTEREDAVLSL
jgi:sugar phosphate isomerase/epimerase